MVRRLKRLLISSAVLASFVLVGAPAAYADPGNGNSANAPGHNKNTTRTQTPSNASQASTSSPGNSDHSQGNAGTSGTYNQPQPYSTADQNNTGANNTSPSNPYKSTRDGSPSLNGNGNGQATGKPCAGCVGKADNKFPPGQAPNGTDRNAGYECDRNNGIGKTNPAHTGCVSAPTPCTGNCTPPPCTHNCTPPPCTHNCGGQGGCTVNCTPGGCQANCGPGQCQTNCTPVICVLNNANCTPPPVCVPSAMTSCVPGRGAGPSPLTPAAITTSGPPLPNTGAADSANWSVIAAIASLLILPVYWRQFVVPKLPKH